MVGPAPRRAHRRRVRTRDRRADALAHPLGVPDRGHARRRSALRLVRSAGAQVGGHRRARRVPGRRLLVRSLLPEQHVPERHGLGEAHGVQQVPVARSDRVRHAVPQPRVRARRARCGVVARAPGASRLVAHAHDGVDGVDLRAPAAVPALERPHPAVLHPRAVPARRTQRRPDRPVARARRGRPAAHGSRAGLGQPRRTHRSVPGRADRARRRAARAARWLGRLRPGGHGRLHLPLARHRLPEAEHLGRLGALQLHGARAARGVPRVRRDHVDHA